MTDVRVFVPLNKVDAAQRLVFGKITQEVVDKSGEVMDYASSRPNFESWSNEIAKATGGKSVGNVRAMHGAVAAGKLTDMVYDDLTKSIEVCAKIVDDNEWAKVEEGVYTGFSVGGSYGKRWTDTIDGQTIKKYTAVPQEVSLVDNPCVGTAHFDYIKADGAVMQKNFQLWEPTNDAVLAKADLLKAAGSTGDLIAEARAALLLERAEASMVIEDDLAKATPSHEEVGTNAGRPDNHDEGPLDKTATDETVKNDAEALPAEPVQKWVAADGQAFDKKVDCAAYNLTLVKKTDTVPVPAEVTDLQKSIDGLAAVLSPHPTVAVLAVQDDLVRMSEVIVHVYGKAAEGKPLMKGLYDVGRFAELLASFGRLQRSAAYEAKEEGDNSTIPADLLALMQKTGDVFLEMAREEVAELVAGLAPPELEYYCCAASADDLVKDAGVLFDWVKADGDRLEKAGARNAKLDAERLQKAHDAVVEAGAMCPGGDSDKMAKAATVEQENAALKDAMAKMVPQVEALTKAVADLRSQPLPPAHQTFTIVEKGGAPEPTETVEGILGKMLESQGPEAVAQAMFKISQRNPLPVGKPR